MTNTWILTYKDLYWLILHADFKKFFRKDFENVVLKLIGQIGLNDIFVSIG